MYAVLWNDIISCWYRYDGFDIGFTGIVFVFFIYTLNGMTKDVKDTKEKLYTPVSLQKENIICQTLHPPMKKLKNSIRIMAMAM